MRKSGYFKNLGLNNYWFASIIVQIIENRQDYFVELHDILAVDDTALELCKKFPRWTNLHFFISGVFERIISEPTEEASELFKEFLKKTDTPEDEISEIERDPGEFFFTQDYYDGLGHFVEDIFHILFRDVVLLERFNEMTSFYISELDDDAKSDRDTFTNKGTLRRVNLPIFVRDVIYFRDGGECRKCKIAINRDLSPEARERYDHIIPLNHCGANDITNIQLLCETCNTQKSDKLEAASKLYPRVYKISDADRY